MGGSAAGAAIWGQIATLTGVAESIAASAVFGVAALALARRARIQGEVEDDTRPVPRLRDPEIAAPVDPDEGPVMVTIEYEFDPTESDRFTPVMEATRSARLRLGVLSWGFFRDVAAPGRYIEYFVDESWVAHLRRLERFTADDMQLREQRLALHRGEGPPVVRRYVGQRLVA
jgi:hypothetical protein